MREIWQSLTSSELPETRVLPLILVWSSRPGDCSPEAPSALDMQIPRIQLGV
jgi:hypothetical protein